MAIANAGEAVLVPAVSAGSCMVVRERFPGCTIWTIVLAHGSPRPFAQIGAPAFPMAFAPRVFIQALLFCHERGMGNGRGLTLRGHTTPSVEREHIKSR